MKVELPSLFCQEQPMTHASKHIAIIGGGPAGLMAAYQLCQIPGLVIDVFEQKPSVGRKFLIAGRGGLNLTNAEPHESFLARYEEGADFMAPHLAAFTPDQLRSWAHDLGIETFVGSSGRVFPKEMKATNLMRAWTKYLSAKGVRFHLQYKWNGFDPAGKLLFTAPQGISVIPAPDATLLALGGASYAHLGATGDWLGHLEKFGIASLPFAPINCGYECHWSDHILPKFEGAYFKNITVSYKKGADDLKSGRGDMILTSYGLEGGALYAISPALTQQMSKSGPVTISLDLRPDMTEAELEDRLQHQGKASLSNHLRKKLKLSPLELAVLYELTTRADLQTPAGIAAAVKSLPIKLNAPRPMDRAISVMGGIALKEVTVTLMLKKAPGIFVAGEMMDWHAPTGGYLLQGCFSTAVTAAEGIKSYLAKN